MRQAITGLMLIMMTSTSALAIECRSSKGGDGYWSWRLIDGKKCWYAGQRMIDKSKLYWTTDLDKRAAAPSRIIDTTAPPPAAEAPNPPEIDLPTALQIQAEKLRIEAQRVQTVAFFKPEPEPEPPVPLPLPRPPTAPKLREHYYSQYLPPVLLTVFLICIAAFKRRDEVDDYPSHRTATNTSVFAGTITEDILRRVRQSIRA